MVLHVEDLLKPEFAHTVDNQQFLRAMNLYPTFLFLHASEYQLNLLRKYKVPDQLYVDGTFKTVPEGITQLITIRMRQQKEAGSKLVATAMLKSKATVDYQRMWMELALIVRCITERNICHKICQYCSSLRTVLRQVLFIRQQSISTKYLGSFQDSSET